MLKQKFIVKLRWTKAEDHDSHAKWVYWIDVHGTFPAGFTTNFANATRFDSYSDAEQIIFDNCKVQRSYAIDKVYEVEGN